MNFEHEGRRLLVALWIDSHGPNRLLDGDQLALEYGIRLPSEWLNAHAAELKSKGWATVFSSYDGVSLRLRPEGFRHGLAAGLELTKGSQLEVQFGQREIFHDGTTPPDMPGGPGWKYLEFGQDVPPSDVVIGSPALAEPLRSLSLDQEDPEYLQVEAAFQTIINSVEGDNELIERERALARLRNAASLWDSASIRVIELKVGVIMAIDDVCEWASSAYYAGALAGLRQLVKSFAKEKLHLDLDGIL